MAKYHSMLESYLSYDSSFYFILYRRYNGIELDGDVVVVVVLKMLYGRWQSLFSCLNKIK